VKIQKASGQHEPFSEEKLWQSLVSSGASEDTVGRVMAKVARQVHRGTSTHHLYRLAHAALKKEAREFAARYHLKQALLQLGPTGYPFEHYVAAVFSAQEYATRTGVTLKGRCVSHEVDVVAENKQQTVLAECKYRNAQGKPTDIKVALYVHARAQDLRQNPEHRFTDFYLVTNSRFTKDALTYGRCSGLKLVGWDFPENRGLQTLIEAHGLFPLTCLTSLKRRDKEWLLEKGVVLCRTLLEKPKWLQDLRLRNAERLEVLDEATRLLGNVQKGADFERSAGRGGQRA
jgi:hypothetical protein